MLKLWLFEVAKSYGGLERFCVIVHIFLSNS